jgi:hypothetical protein
MLSWTGDVAYNADIRNVYEGLAETPEWMRTLGRPRSR